MIDSSITVFLYNLIFDVTESLFFALVTEHSQEKSQLPKGIGMHKPGIPGSFQIFQRRSVGVVPAAVDLACGNTVHDHFQQKFHRHGNGTVFLGSRQQIRPVFKVMAVAALVVHPRLGITHILTLGSIGTAVSLIIPRTGKEFRRAVFGQIVHQSAAVQAHLKTMLHDQMTVACDGFEMSP